MAVAVGVQIIKVLVRSVQEGGRAAGQDWCQCHLIGVPADPEHVSANAGVEGGFEEPGSDVQSGQPESTGRQPDQPDVGIVRARPVRRKAPLELMAATKPQFLESVQPVQGGMNRSGKAVPVQHELLDLTQPTQFRGNGAREFVPVKMEPQKTRGVPKFPRDRP